MAFALHLFFSAAKLTLYGLPSDSSSDLDARCVIYTTIVQTPVQIMINLTNAGAVRSGELSEW